jgi:nitronate monooxygenase
MVLDELAVPIVQAPMAGGPSTPQLAAAVSNAGGLGFVGAGYRSVGAMREDIAATRAATPRAFGVSLFVPVPGPADPAVVDAFRREVEPDAAAAGVALGDARFDDDAFGAKVDALCKERIAVAHVAFGLPPREATRALKAAGSEVWVTVTTAEEGGLAAEAGADAIVAQGVEAGGHRGSFARGDAGGQLGVLALVQLLVAAGGPPVVASGGLMTGGAVAAVLAAGARAAQLGSAFLLAPEAGTSTPHRDAVASPAPTALTRAFSGRLARGIENRFLLEHGPTAPAAYPEVHHITTPLRAHGRSTGDGDVVNLWAGQAHELARPEPAGQIVRRIAAEAAEALALAHSHLTPRPV